MSVVVGGELLKHLSDDYWNRGEYVDEEANHPWVGKTIRIKDSGKTYVVYKAYDRKEGVYVRVKLDGGSRTLKPEEYELCKA